MSRLIEYLYKPKKRYRLLPDQVGRIKDRIDRLKEKDINGSSKQEIQRLEDVLNNHSLAHINYKYIDIGTCFTVTEIYLGERKTRKYQLVDFLETLKNHYDETGEYTRILLDSHIGEAIYGKKVGDAFSYSNNATLALTNEKKAKISVGVIGMIEDIKTPTKEVQKTF